MRQPEWMSVLQQHNGARYYGSSTCAAVCDGHIHYYRRDRYCKAAEHDDLQHPRNDMNC